MPAGFKPVGLTASPIYTPYVVSDNPHGVNVIARMKPGISLEAVRSELNVIASHLAREDPERRNLKLTATGMLEQITGAQRRLLILLFGAVSFVLLIACVNVANLMLARSAARWHEIDIRIAQGAGPRHIIRFVLTEALVIALAASAAAVALAYGSLHALKPLTASLPRGDELSVDGHVLLCTLILGVTAALFFGIVPALRSAHPGSVGGMRSRVTAKWQGSLVAGEIALAFVLLAGAGLLIRTFAAIRSTNLGYNPQNVLTYFLALPPSSDGSRSSGVALYARIRDRLQALPGVRAVSTASGIPMEGVSISMDVHPEGAPERRHQHEASLDVVGDDYFRVMRIPLRAGRAFTLSDRPGSTPVVIVSESIARAYFGGKPIGKRIILPELKFNVDGGQDVANEIVGVVGNVCVASVADCEAEHIYLPESQNGLRVTYILVLIEGNPAMVARAVRHAVYLETPTTPLGAVQTLEERTSYLTDGPKRAMWLLGVFVGLALLLAGFGIYGVSAYLATQRSREIAIRMALGAEAREILGLMYGGTFLAAALGLTAGVGVAAALERLLNSLLFGVRPGDPASMAVAAIVLLSVSLFAATGPALRATLTDPAQILRRE